MDKIRRADALRLMEVHEDADGRRNVFSVQYYKKNGEVAYVPRAVAAGLRASMRKNRLRGVLPVDADGNPCGHAIALPIDNIRLFNGKRVVL